MGASQSRSKPRVAASVKSVTDDFGSRLAVDECFRGGPMMRKARKEATFPLVSKVRIGDFRHV